MMNQASNEFEGVYSEEDKQPEYEEEPILLLRVKRNIVKSKYLKDFLLPVLLLRGVRNMSPRDTSRRHICCESP
jgi:hypothetical protein